jgi:hypothetical protein
MTATVVVFALVYAGRIGGGLPLLQLDRTGLAGSLFIVGSVANVVVDAATARGIRIDRRTHAGWACR